MTWLSGMTFVIVKLCTRFQVLLSRHGHSANGWIQWHPARVHHPGSPWLCDQRCCGSPASFQRLGLQRRYAGCRMNQTLKQSCCFLSSRHDFIIVIIPFLGSRLVLSPTQGFQFCVAPHVEEGAERGRCWFGLGEAGLWHQGGHPLLH